MKILSIIKKKLLIALYSSVFKSSTQRRCKGCSINLQVVRRMVYCNLKIAVVFRYWNKESIAFGCENCHLLILGPKGTYEILSGFTQQALWEGERAIGHNCQFFALSAIKRPIHHARMFVDHEKKKAYLLLLL